MYNLFATITTYDKSEGNLALRALAFALKDDKAVSVGVQTTPSGIRRAQTATRGITAANHQIVVTGIDFDRKSRHLNDSGYGEEPGTNKGKNMRVPLDAFMKAWQFDNYETMTAVRAPLIRVRRE